MIPHARSTAADTSELSVAPNSWMRGCTSMMTTVSGRPAKCRARTSVLSRAMTPVTASVTAAVDGQLAEGTARSLDGRDNDRQLKGLLGWFVLQPLHEGDGIVADVLDRHRGWLFLQRERVYDHDAD